MPASIHLHWNNPVRMIVGLQLFREDSFTLKMEAVASKLQLSTSLYSDPYWKSDMSNSWLFIEICFSLLFWKNWRLAHANIAAYTHFSVMYHWFRCVKFSL